MDYNIVGMPSRYIQGRDILNRIDKFVANYGKKFLLLTDKIVYELISDKMKLAFDSSGLKFVWLEFDGECTESEIARACKFFSENKFDAIIGAGGGRAVDAAKAVGFYCKTNTIIFPTIAATDAPCSFHAIINEENEAPRLLYVLKAPDLVLVDVDIIAKAPVRTLVAGIGDAFATYYEARACMQANSNTNLGGLTNLDSGKGLRMKSAYALAELCNDMLLEDGVKAKIAAENQTVTKALENIIEANIFLSGAGFVNNGCAVAHSFFNGVASLPRRQDFMHGEYVAFGTLVQLVLENVPFEEFEAVQKFYKSVGLPLTLKDIGLDKLSDDEMKKAVDVAMENKITHNMPFKVTAESFMDAIVNADYLGKQHL